MNESYLTGKQVYLRTIEESDLICLTKFNNEKDTRILADDDAPFPTSIKDFETFIASNELGKNFAVCRQTDHELLGSVALYAVNYQNLHCELGITLSEQFQGNGYGKDALTVIIHFIFTYLPLNKIKLQVFSFNPKAIHLYEQLGFKHEGTLKEEIFRFSAFQDLENYALLRKDWSAYS